MKSLVLFALISVSTAFIQDTPEVQAEKAKFYQLFNKQAAAAAAAPDINVYPQPQQKQQYQPTANHQQFRHQQQFSPNSINTFAGHQMQQTFTPHQQTFTPHQPQQVHHQQAFRSHQPQQVHNQYQSQPQYTAKWTGPVAATVPAGLPGSVSQVQNTPEVEAAIANFNQAFNAALISTKSVSPKQNSYQGSASRNVYQVAPKHGVHQSARNTFQTFHQQNAIHTPQAHYKPAAPIQPKWTGPVAATVPAGLPGSVSQVADTPEVQAAKAQFLQNFQRQLSYSG